MLSFKRLMGLFGRERLLKKAAPRKHQARLSLETLETRDGPAALNFVSPAAIWAGAVINGKSADIHTASLRASHSGDVAKRADNSYPERQAYAYLQFFPSTNDKTIRATTSAFARGNNSYAEALMRTTSNGQDYQYVTVRIDPTAYGEQYGQRVRVTLQASFSSSIGQFNTGYAANAYSFYVNGTQYLGGKDTTRDVGANRPEEFRRTITLNATIGQSFQIAFHTHSQAGSGAQNVATNSFVLNMGVQRV